ncbi:hypothetical protein HF086_004200 [Spodoptera exigua]|uniref:Uncharacterized protein n=1 Tax=Spodoptera exigua TaxID=7107 RepID=A0A922ML35_SPOEX|nr:hypothetical protein HF086_004200 [Spodoptera exigua]
MLHCVYGMNKSGRIITFCILIDPAVAAHEGVRIREADRDRRAAPHQFGAAHPPYGAHDHATVAAALTARADIDITKASEEKLGQIFCNISDVM